MSWDAIAALSQLVAAVAVVVSLIYLAVQVRQNTRQLVEQTKSHHLSSLSDVGHGFREFRASVARDQQVASVWWRGISNLPSLNDAERLQFDFLAIEFFWSLGMMWLYVEQGVFEPWLFEHSRRNVLLYAGPGLKEWWQTSKYRQDYPAGYIPRIDQIFEYPLGSRQELDERTPVGAQRAAQLATLAAT